ARAVPGIPTRSGGQRRNIYEPPSCAHAPSGCASTRSVVHRRRFVLGHCDRGRQGAGEGRRGDELIRVITLRHHPSARTCGSACEMLPNDAFGGNVERGARELARAQLLTSDGARELFFAHPGATGDAQIFGLLVQLLLGAPEEVDAAEGLAPSASLRLR